MACPARHTYKQRARIHLHMFVQADRQLAAFMLPHDAACTSPLFRKQCPCMLTMCSKAINTSAHGQIVADLCLIAADAGTHSGPLAWHE